MQVEFVGRLVVVEATMGGGMVMGRLDGIDTGWVTLEDSGDVEKVKPESSLLLSKTSVLALFCLIEFPTLRCACVSPSLNMCVHWGQCSDKEVLSNFRLQDSFLHVFCILAED